MKRSWIAILTLLTQLVDQHAQRTIEYLKEENQILFQKLGKKRLILTDQERLRLAVTAVPTAVAAPMMNAHAERFVRAVKYESLNKLILTNEAQLRYVLDEYLDYYHHERFHKGLGRIIEPKPEYQTVSGEIVCMERLGSLLKSYHRKAA